VERARRRGRREEHQGEEPGGVERRERAREQQRGEEQRLIDRGHGDRLLAEEAGCGRDRGQAEGPDPKGDRGPAQPVSEAAEPREILLAAGRVDHRSGPEEQCGLEERVREEVEQCREDRAEAGGDEHEPDLRDRRPGEDALQVALAQRDDRRYERGRRADA